MSKFREKDQIPRLRSKFRSPRKTVGTSDTHVIKRLHESKHRQM